MTASKDNLPAGPAEVADIIPVYQILGWPEPGESPEEAELRLLVTIFEAGTTEEVFAPWTGDGTDDVDGKALSMLSLERFWIIREELWIPGLRIKAVDLATGEEMAFVTTARAIVTQAAKLEALGALGVKVRVVGVTSANTGRRSYHFEPA